MRSILDKTFCELHEKDNRVILFTCDVVQNVDDYCVKGYPFFNTGLTEQSTIGIAAGMASQGYRPIVYSITPFVLERPFEFIKINIDENMLPVILIGYDDYPTHGPTHRALNPKDMVKLFKNVKGFYPETKEQAKKAIFDAYLMNVPSFIHLKKDGLPFI